MNLRHWIVAAGGVLVVMMAGCSESGEAIDAGATAAVTPSEGASQSAPSRPTLTESRLQPPPQQNEYTTEGRPEVVFDPCTWISDEAVGAVGLDPTTRRRGDDMVAEYTFLTCDFKGPLRDLQINSGNVTWDEDLQKNGAHSEPLTVNGREALLVQDPALKRVCSVHVRTKVGLVMFSSARTFEGSEAGLQRCDGVVEIAEGLEPEIGSEN
ncbi:DUF3558 domain-containing protein [Nocardia sp. NPDC024068]|uniref:DUF3558 domain-containing protein n=1 Tax=Nocardia sp. NPDC024068 TaxID=3157197 RepID=UPI0033E14DB1